MERSHCAKHKNRQTRSKFTYISLIYVFVRNKSKDFLVDPSDRSTKSAGTAHICVQHKHIVHFTLHNSASSSPCPRERGDLHSKHPSSRIWPTSLKRLYPSVILIGIGLGTSITKNFPSRIGPLNPLGASFSGWQR